MPGSPWWIGWQSRLKCSAASAATAQARQALRVGGDAGDRAEPGYRLRSAVHGPCTRRSVDPAGRPAVAPPVAVRPIPGPELLVVSPEAVPDPDPIGSTAAARNSRRLSRPGLLWRSAREVFARGALTTPQDMRPLIEATFDRTADGAVPPALAVASDRAEGREMAEVGIASQNVLDVWAGLQSGCRALGVETRTPTRLEDRPMVTLRLARAAGRGRGALCRRS